MVTCPGNGENDADTDLESPGATVIEHWPAPVQPPDHPSNLYPEAGFGVRATCVAVAYDAEHFDGQEMPPEELATVPEPLPS